MIHKHLYISHRDEFCFFHYYGSLFINKRYSDVVSKVNIVSYSCNKMPHKGRLSIIRNTCQVQFPSQCLVPVLVEQTAILSLFFPYHVPKY